jgi:hypothetical protein
LSYLILQESEPTTPVLQKREMVESSGGSFVEKYPAKRRTKSWLAPESGRRGIIKGDSGQFNSVPVNSSSAIEGVRVLAKSYPTRRRSLRSEKTPMQIPLPFGAWSVKTFTECSPNVPQMLPECSLNFDLLNVAEVFADVKKSARDFAH